MDLTSFLQKIKEQPSSIDFEQTMAVIDTNYEFSATEFRNGSVINGAGENNGSCKIFAFAKMNALDVESTLACFGRFYREDVLKNPAGNDHQNIRNFMELGWDGIQYTGVALVAK
ncbi:MAG: HopJ type III effector protein [Aliivibrio sp.]|uniref:HopJ type III effector protein n=1 Tax=Aliivibrio sp. TaxID=1872443 RepID=UPI001A44CB70|nr:HopJ type III effector protein [Aliivibrio sp.]